MKGAKPAHRITSYDSKPQEPVKEMVVEGRVRVEPMEVMEERVCMWSKYWCPQRAAVCPRDKWVFMLKRVSELRCSEVAGAIRRAPGQAGVGADGGRAASLHSLQVEGKAALTQLFVDMEVLLAVLVQMLCKLVGMLGKPSGGERPITFTTAL